MSTTPTDSVPEDGGDAGTSDELTSEQVFPGLYAQLGHRCVQARAALSAGDVGRTDKIFQQILDALNLIDGLIDPSAQPVVAGRVKTLHYLAITDLKRAKAKHRPFDLRHVPEIFAALEELFAAMLVSDPTGTQSTTPYSAGTLAECSASVGDERELVSSGSGLTLPTFIAVGPPRTGTTWLHHAMAGHIGLPFGIKETNFFTRNYHLGLRWYSAHFQRCQAGETVGEIAPTYFDSSLARERIARDIPECRIVCTLRDPVERMYSHYRILRREAWHGTMDFVRTLDQHLTWQGSGNLFEGSDYATHLTQWQNLFGADNVLVAFHDDLRLDPQGYLDSVCRFVGAPRILLTPGHDSIRRRNVVERCPADPQLASYAREVWDRMQRRRLYSLMRLFAPFWDYCFGGGPDFEPLAPEVERRLRRRLLPKIEELERQTGRDLSTWKSGRHLRGGRSLSGGR